jgi:hypothetical protein
LIDFFIGFAAKLGFKLRQQHIAFAQIKRKQLRRPGESSRTQLDFNTILTLRLDDA